MNIRTVSLRLLLIFGGLMLALVAVELLLRLSALRSPAGLSQKNDRPSFYYRPEGAANWHNPPFSQEKPASVFRIIALGDSFTFPHLMQFDDAYPKRLERMLNLGGADSPRQAEVLNFAFSGLCTQQQLSILEKALELEPDLVLLQFTINDIDCRNFNQLIKSGVADYTLGDLRISREQTPLLYYSQALRAAAEFQHNRRTKASFIRFNLDLYHNAELWLDFRRSVLQLKQRAAAQQVPLVALMIPFLHFPLDEHYPFQEIHQRLARFWDRITLPHLDLWEALSGLDHKRLQVLPGQDSHPNEIAHRILAEALYDWLATSDYLPADLLIKQRYPHRHTRKPPAD